jgi:hypothetical protein
LLETHDSGASWLAQTGIPLDDGYLSAITCPTVCDCYAVGEAASGDGATNGLILATTNSVGAWTAQTVPSA